MKLRLAFDLDETLGIPIVNDSSIQGFKVRPGAIQLLETLYRDHKLLLWTVASRRYVDKVLSYGLAQYFIEVYSWDEIATGWKDIRKIGADFLIDDSSHHREEARRHGLEHRYIVVPAYGSLEDRKDPLLWARQVERGLSSEAIP